MELLFDLDGTLTDPARGITACMTHALASMGRPSPPTEDLLRYIGPPLRDTFVELLGTMDTGAIDSAVRHYRERFARIGLYENAMYPDVREGLASLRGKGHRLWVATSKPEVFARRIVKHFELDALFEGVYGSELSGERADKATLIAHILEREHLNAAGVWMIGDRAHDVIGGRANGTRTVGVLWGYGSPDELRGAEPDGLVDSMATLTRFIDEARPNASR